jgi:hypothetical protein
LLSSQALPPIITNADAAEIAATSALPPSNTATAAAMSDHPKRLIFRPKGGGAAMSSSKAFSATSGGVAPAWMERIRRSTSLNLEKSMVSFRTTRNTLMGARFEVPTIVNTVMVFRVMSTWQ